MGGIQFRKNFCKRLRKQFLKSSGNNKQKLKKKKNNSYMLQHKGICYNISFRRTKIFVSDFPYICTYMNYLILFYIIPVIYYKYLKIFAQINVESDIKINFITFKNNYISNNEKCTGNYYRLNIMQILRSQTILCIIKLFLYTDTTSQ